MPRRQKGPTDREKALALWASWELDGYDKPQRELADALGFQPEETAEAFETLRRQRRIRRRA